MTDDEPTPSTFRVRRLAVIDLHGFTGSSRRRRLVQAEFLATTAICAGLGVVFFRSGSVPGVLMGLIAVGIGFNYAVLLTWAIVLRDPERLAREFRAHDIRRDGASHTRRSLLLIVPFIFVPLSLRRVERRA